MCAMTPRERVWAAFSHTQPDRVPVDMMGTASCLMDPAYFALRDHLGLVGEGRVFRKGQAITYYDDRILEALEVDFRRVWLREPANWQPTLLEDGAVTDEWGLHLKRVGDTLNVVSAPLANATIGDLDQHPWPDPYDPGRVAGLAEEARRLRQTTEYAISARSPFYGIFEIAQRLRGMQQFLMDLVADKKFATALIHKVKEVQMGFFDAYLGAVGPYVDMVEHSDDLGSQNGPLISPRTFKEIIAPARRELNELIKRKAPNAKVFLHSDGSIFKLIPYLIETGVEVLNPVEPDAAGNVPEDLKKTFGSELVFHGHVDTKGALRGTIEDTRAEVRRVVDTLAVGGGYIMAPTNHFQVDVPPENVVELYRYAHAYGRRAGA
ncbi:MAG TPA: uroporphyrinogen decarboxylase family protein [Anaerolineae bacterium]|nr:uroporphyrinogen decarboxylase family protein [Anaerolineae bacterium]